LNHPVTFPHSPENHPKNAPITFPQAFQESMIESMIARRTPRSSQIRSSGSHTNITPSGTVRSVSKKYVNARDQRADGEDDQADRVRGLDQVHRDHRHLERDQHDAHGLQRGRELIPVLDRPGDALADLLDGVRDGPAERLRELLALG
jgi:hypothetical protein